MRRKLIRVKLGPALGALTLYHPTSITHTTEDCSPGKEGQWWAPTWTTDTVLPTRNRRPATHSGPRWTHSFFEWTCVQNDPFQRSPFSLQNDIPLLHLWDLPIHDFAIFCLFQVVIVCCSWKPCFAGKIIVLLFTAKKILFYMLLTMTFYH